MYSKLLFGLVWPNSGAVSYMSLRVAPTSIDDADEKGMASELTCPTETNLILQPIVVTNRKGLNHRASNAICERSSRFMNVQSAGIAQTIGGLAEASGTIQTAVRHHQAT